MKRLILIGIISLCNSVLFAQYRMGSFGDYSVKKELDKHTFSFEFVSGQIIVEKTKEEGYGHAEYIARLDNDFIKIRFKASFKDIFVREVIAGKFFTPEEIAKKRETVPFEGSGYSPYYNVLEAFIQLFEYDMKVWPEEGFYDNEQQNAYCMMFNKDYIYRGKLENGELNGEGVLYLKDGTKIKSDFKNGQRDGHTVISEPDKLVIGNYILGKKEGTFSVKYSSGKRVKVEYKNDTQVNGTGVLLRDDVGISSKTLFEEDIDYLEKLFRKNGLLVAGPRTSKNAEFGTVVASSFDKELKPNKTYTGVIVVDRTKTSCTELKVGLDLRYYSGSTTQLEQQSKTVTPKHVDSRVSANQLTYFFTFEIGSNYKSMVIIASSECESPKNAKLFIISTD